MGQVLHHTKVKHINFAVIDIEGGELEALRAIPWKQVTFDVFCIETEPKFRPPRFNEEVIAFLKERGYNDYTGDNVGKQRWFVRKDFKPFTRPELNRECFNGHLRAMGHKKVFRDCQVTAVRG